MKITAVILHYWEERLGNIDPIITSLRNGLRAPDEILLFNNNPKYNLSKKGVKCINSAINFGSGSRYPVSLLEPSDWYLFIDDDLNVKEGTLRALEQAAEGLPEPVNLGLMGRKLQGKKYSQTDITRGDKVTELTEVDVLIRIYFVPFSGVMKMLQFEHDNPEIKTDDDIYLSFSDFCFVVPAKDGEYIKELDAGGVGLEKRKDHFSNRDEVVSKLLNA